MATAETAMIQPGDDDKDAARRGKQQSIRLWKTIGATQVVNRIAAALGSQAMTALARVRDEKLYLAAGYETFREFLDTDPESPMSYDQFNRREKLLDSEGPVMFDLLNSLNVAQRDRKLLVGQIEVEGDEIRIGEDRCDLNDKDALIVFVNDVYSKLHHQVQQQDKKLERGQRDFDRLKRRLDDAESRATLANPSGTETGDALVTYLGASKKLCDALKSASDEEKRALTDSVFDVLRNTQLECSVALGVIDESEANHNLDEEVE